VRESLEHLSRLGHRSVTVLSWAVETLPDRQAERAVAASAAALGLDCRVVGCAYSLNGSRPLALELLGSDQRPSAVLCLSDSIAYGSTRPAPSWGRRSRATSPSPASAITRSRGCWRRR
jgi:LacI family transcriptional regulator